MSTNTSSVAELSPIPSPNVSESNVSLKENDDDELEILSVKKVEATDNNNAVNIDDIGFGFMTVMTCDVSVVFLAKYWGSGIAGSVCYNLCSIHNLYCLCNLLKYVFLL